MLDTVLDYSASLLQLWENVMEVILKIDKTNTMTNTRGKTKTRGAQWTIKGLEGTMTNNAQVQGVVDLKLSTKFSLSWTRNPVLI